MLAPFVLALSLAISTPVVPTPVADVDFEAPVMTREQVIAKLGLPDATRSLGKGREDLYYCKQVALRVMLKDGVMFDGVITQDDAQRPAACGRKTLA